MRRQRRGMSIIEVAISMVILAVAATVMSSTFSGSQALNETASDIALARRLAARQVAIFNRVVTRDRNPELNVTLGGPTANERESEGGEEHYLRPIANGGPFDMVERGDTFPNIWAPANARYDMSFAGGRVTLNNGIVSLDRVVGPFRSTILPQDNGWHIRDHLDAEEVNLINSRNMSVVVYLAPLVVRAVPDTAGTAFGPGAPAFSTHSTQCTWAYQIDVVKYQGTGNDQFLVRLLGVGP